MMMKMLSSNKVDTWRDIEGYEGVYQVSSSGRVRSLDRVVTYKDGHSQRLPGKLLNINYDDSGYVIVTLYKSGQPKVFGVHRLVAEAFLPNPDTLAEVNHLDRNPANNCVANLEWISHRNNVIHACRTGVNYCYRIRHLESGLEFWSAEECGRHFKVSGNTILYLARNPECISRKLPGQHFELISDLERGRL